MVRWQRDLASGGRFADATLVELSEKFLSRFEKREVGIRDYPDGLKGMLAPLKALAARTGDGELAKRYEALARAAGIEPAEAAHRDLMMRMEELAR
jgi:hypothetical protein